MKLTTIQTIAMALTVSSTALAQQPADRRPQQPTGTRASSVAQEKLDAGDQQFVRKAAEGGHAEVALAKLAQEKASNTDVKSYAERLERDHARANDELTSVAKGKSITLPDAPAKPGATAARLSKLSGAAFDKAYIAAMIQDHQKDIKAFEREAEHGADAEVKGFAARTLPTLKEHLHQAQEIARSLGSARTNS